MSTPTPLDAVTKLVESRNKGDTETALALYEPTATLVAQPGVVVSGADAVRASLLRFASLSPVFESTSRQIVESGDVALHCSEWTLKGTDPRGKPIQMAGRTADVLRKQASGNWLIAIDNPWGTAILN